MHSRSYRQTLNCNLNDIVKIQVLLVVWAWGCRELKEVWRLVTLKMRQKDFQEQGEEGNSASENEEQINCGVRAWEETGMLGRIEYPVSADESK